MRRMAGWWMAGVLALVGCGAGTGVEELTPGAPVAAERTLPSEGASGISAMTRNLYVGTDVSAILKVPSLAQLPVAVAQAYAQVQASNPPARMAKIADEIVATHPAVVGLQEVDLIRVQNPAAPTPATSVAYDFLQLLLDALDARGAHYVPAVVGNEADIEAPALNGTGGLMDVRLTDRDVLLVRSDVEVSSPQAHHYSTYLSVPVAGSSLTVDVLRGWVEADVTLGGHTLHAVDTHLEAFSDAIQEVQGDELRQHLAGVGRPVLLMGDLNSPSDGSGSSSYSDFLQAGYADTWLYTHPAGPGLTCCNADDLMNATPDFTQRIDYLLLRLPDTANKDFVGAASDLVVGMDPSDKTAGGLWPSDHAGVVSLLRLPSGLRFTSR